MSRLRIAEIFTSVQGEGLWVGTPSVFVRVSGCNLRCRWCDTPYASWNPEGPVRRVEEVVADVRERGVRHVVVTGGEPMAFEPIEELCEQLRANGHTITIETAGTVMREVACDLMSISPKLKNSTPDEQSGWAERHEATRYRPEVVRALMDRYAYQLKFVVSSPGDLQEIDAFLSAVGPFDPDRVLLMPEGTDSVTIHARGRELVPICIERGWKLATRLHIDLFGNVKGT